MARHHHALTFGEQCGGKHYDGPTRCGEGLICKYINEWYSQCRYDDQDPGVPLYKQCGGKGYTGPTKCVKAAVCKKQNPYYSQCLPK
jgi:hypothetical protein